MIFLLELLSLLGLGASSQQYSNMQIEPCTTARNECTTALTCGSVLHSYDIVCVSGSSDKCSEQCTRMSVQLFTIFRHIAIALTKCDCQGSRHCEKRQEKLLSECVAVMVSALEPGSSESPRNLAAVGFRPNLCNWVIIFQFYYLHYCIVTMWYSAGYL